MSFARSTNHRSPTSCWRSGLLIGTAIIAMMFSPTEFVDISAAEPRKRAACYAHASQRPEKWYPLEEDLTRFRGAESGYTQAEAFVRHWESRAGPLP
jgi:N-acetylglucosamine malate deacetylase 1